MATQAVSIYFGTETGHSRLVAERAAAKLAENGYEVQIFDLKETPAAQLMTEAAPAVFVISTWEHGQPPFLSRRFFAELMSGGIKIPGLRYAVAALGDEHFGENFCRGGKMLDTILERAGGTRFMPRTDIGQKYATEASSFASAIFHALKEMDGKEAPKA